STDYRSRSTGSVIRSDLGLARLKVVCAPSSVSGNASTMPPEERQMLTQERQMLTLRSSEHGQLGRSCRFSQRRIRLGVNSRPASVSPDALDGCTVAPRRLNLCAHSFSSAYERGG